MFWERKALYSLNHEGELRAPQRHCGSFFPFWTRQLVVVFFFFSPIFSKVSMVISLMYEMDWFPNLLDLIYIHSWQSSRIEEAQFKKKKEKKKENLEGD